MQAPAGTLATQGADTMAAPAAASGGHQGDLLKRDADAANLLSDFLALRQLDDIAAANADLCIVCGSSVLATV